MSRAEKGEENLTLETLVQMTGVLGIVMPDFFGTGNACFERVIADQARPPRR